MVHGHVDNGLDALRTHAASHFVPRGHNRAAVAADQGWTLVLATSDNGLWLGSRGLPSVGPRLTATTRAMRAAAAAAAGRFLNRTMMLLAMVVVVAMMNMDMMLHDNGRLGLCATLGVPPVDGIFRCGSVPPIASRSV
jgi:hypothetical protein